MLAARALTCIGNELRLKVIRHLVRCGPDGDFSGRMALVMGIPASTMSFHLGQLEEAGLAISWRVSRSIRYSANLHAIRSLLIFLVDDCCQGNPQVCGEIPGIEEMTNSRLGDITMNNEKVYNVLFLCTGNSARSIMAECILNRYGQGRFKAWSAGSEPKGEINPRAIHYLKLQNYPTQNLRSKGIDEFMVDDAPVMDFVFTVCDHAAESCPTWPHQPMTAHWGIPDPSETIGSDTEINLAFAESMRLLTNRISIFTNLPLRSLDRLALQQRLDSIGRVIEDPEEVA